MFFDDFVSLWAWIYNRGTLDAVGVKFWVQTLSRVWGLRFKP